MTPKELMKSRYEAFTREDWEYIASTSTNQNVEELQSSTSIDWLKLDILYAKDNIVEFKAYYKIYNTIELMHEKSYFVKVDEVWKYDRGELYNSKIGRNEECPCGSNKKFKNCCRV